jgi:hypothetical protein
MNMAVTFFSRLIRGAIILAAASGSMGSASATSYLFDFIYDDGFNRTQNRASFSIPEGRLPDNLGGDPIYNLPLSYDFDAPVQTQVGFYENGAPPIQFFDGPFQNFVTGNATPLFTGSPRDPLFTPGVSRYIDAFAPNAQASLSIRVARPVYNFRIEGANVIEWQLSGTPMAGPDSLIQFQAIVPGKVNGISQELQLAARLPSSFDPSGTVRTSFPASSLRRSSALVPMMCSILTHARRCA